MNKISLVKIVSLITPLCIFNSSNATTNIHNSSFQTKQGKLKKLGIPEGWVQIGQSVYSPTGIPALAVCMADVTPQNIKYLNGIAHLTLNNHTSLQEYKDYFNMNMQAKADWWIFSTSASASFTHNTEDNDYTRNFRYLQDFGWDASFQMQKWGLDSLTNLGRQLYNLDKDKEQFIKVCGDSFVREAYAGLLLGVNMRIKFKSHLDQQSFNSSVGFGVIGLGQVTAAVSRFLQTKTMDANIEIDALQIGGMPDKLARIFSKGKDGYYVANCSFKDLKSCDGIINGVLDYARTLSDQVRDRDGKLIYENLAYYKPSTLFYRQWGIPLETPQISDQVKLAQGKLQQLMQQPQKYKNFVNSYLQSDIAPKFTPNMSSFLLEQATKLENQMKIISIKGIGCYTPEDINNCPKIYDSISDQINKDPEYIVNFISLDRLNNQVNFEFTVFGKSDKRALFPYDFYRYSRGVGSLCFIDQDGNTWISNTTGISWSSIGIRTSDDKRIPGYDYFDCGMARIGVTSEYMGDCWDFDHMKKLGFGKATVSRISPL